MTIINIITIIASTLKKVRRVILPPMKLQSDISDVVYLNFLVDIKHINPTIIPKLPIIEINGKTLFTILTYKHKNFRPSLLNRFKIFFPSPLQSNWRFYLDVKDKNSIFFVKNILSSRLISILASLMSDAMNVVFKQPFTHQSYADTIQTNISGKPHNTFDLQNEVCLTNKHDFPPELLKYFKDEETILQYLCNQDFAYNYLEQETYCKSKISLDYEVSQLQPLKVVHFHSQWIQKNFGDVEIFSFLMPKVVLKTLDEKIISQDSY